jgi:hypothetical protein
MVHGALVELLHKQLDSKEQIIRSQQDTINELRLTLSSQQRESQKEKDSLAEKLR